jgi:hypothetical protein
MPRFPITWRFLVRRGWMLVLGFALGLGAAYAISGITVSATSAMSVRTVGYYQPPYEGERLALSYAQLLPEEPTLVRAISKATGLSGSEVRDNLTMNALPETNIAFVRFTSDSEATAKAALEAFAAALERGTDSAGTRLSDSVRPLTQPTLRSGFSRSRALALGALAGFALALALALALERRRPRVDDRRDLARIVPVVVTGGPLPSPPEPDALVVPRGTPEVEVEEAFRAGAADGRSFSTAHFVNRRSQIRTWQRGVDGPLAE